MRKRRHSSEKVTTREEKGLFGTFLYTKKWRKLLNCIFSKQYINFIPVSTLLLEVSIQQPPSVSGCGHLLVLPRRVLLLSFLLGSHQALDMICLALFQKYDKEK